MAELNKRYYPGVYDVTRKALHSYVCSAMVNYYAIRHDMYAEMVTDALQPTTPKEILFVRPDRSQVCGRISFKNHLASAGRMQTNGLVKDALYTLTGISAEAFESVRDRIRREGFRIAQEFLPFGRSAGAKQTGPHIDDIVEDYQQYIETRLTRADFDPHTLKAVAEQIAKGDSASDGLHIPDVEEPSIYVVNRHMPEAAGTYQSFLDWMK